jgi:curved DNA-binding protein CbpA
VSQLWRKLVKLFHPDRCAHEPEKQETYHHLTAYRENSKSESRNPKQILKA